MTIYIYRLVVHDFMIKGERKSILKYFLFLCVALFTCHTSLHAQLPDFTLQVQKQDESCINNGSLTFSTEGTNPLASVLYTVYKYPNLTLPVSVLGTNFLGGLGAGQYKVKAAQILNALSNSKEQDITINHVSIPFAYNITASNQNCTQGAQIAITATSGTATQFEIISGPETRPIQASNVFSALQPGTYNIKAYDSCGEGLVTTYTLSLTNVVLSISEPNIKQTTVPDCGVISVGNTITSSEGTAISYPLSVQYIIHPPDGSPDIIINDLINSGDPLSLELEHVVATYNDLPFSYDAIVTDNCGTVFQRNNQLINPAPVVDYITKSTPCGQKYLELTVRNYVGPYQITFDNIPAGFIPSLFNAQHPGPFNSAFVTYGSEQNVLPEGNYTIKVTDACNRTGIVIAPVANDTKEAVGTARNNGCFSLFGRINVTVPDRNIVIARIMAAPPAYTLPLPQIVTGSIINGKLVLNNVPIGNYVIEVTDQCAAVHNEPVTVPPFVQRSFMTDDRPDCASNTSAVRFWSRNAHLTEASVIAAPAAFGQTIPYNATSDINDQGELYIDNLPAGNYTFKGKDGCGIEETVNVTVAGLQEDPNPFAFVPNCGSFDIDMNDATVLVGAKFWLQKQNPATGVWGHPTTGNVYTEGTLPVAANSRELENDVFTHNITLSGKFRIVRSYESFATGADTKLCLQVLGEFSYSMNLTIANAYTLNCTGNPDDVLIVAENGLTPYTYKILRKDGQPFFLDNGNNDIFTGLQSATYLFEVEDSCSNSKQISLNIATLPSLVDAGDADDIILCGNGQVTNQTFNIRSRDAQILDGLSPELYTVTYHLSQSDADNNLNPQPDSINNTVNNQAVYARVIHNFIPICHEVVSFLLKVNISPVIVMPTQYYICGNGGTVTLEANTGHDTYTWSTGESTRIITVNAPGTYILDVLDNGCPAQATITVSPSDMPSITEIKTVDWTNDDNSITVIASGSGSYVYSLNDGPFQQSNVFENLPVGMYKVTAKDEFGCGEVSEDVVLLNYPKFFTPNGDGENERWRIKFATQEPDLQVYIFDRYGKLITGFTGQGEGWDGMLNGEPLPSTDYWFVVERESGMVYKGHFSLIR